MNWIENKEGIVIINELFRLDADSNYAYLKIGNKKIIHIYLHIVATKDFTGSMTGFVVQLPDAVTPRSPMNGVANDKYSWTYGGKFGFNSYKKDTSTGFKANDQFFIDKTYVL